MIQTLLMKIWLIIPHANWHGILGFAFNTFLSVLAISSGFFPKSDLLIPLCRRLQPYSRDCIPDIYRDGSRCAWHRFWKGLLVLALASVWGWLFWLKFFSCNQVMTQNHPFLNWIHTDQQHRPSSLCNSAFLTLPWISLNPHWQLQSVIFFDRSTLPFH